MQSLGYLEEGTIVNPKDESETYNNKYYNLTWSSNNNQYTYELQNFCPNGYTEYK